MGLLYLLHRALGMLSPSWGFFPYAFVAQPVPTKPLLPAALAQQGRSERLCPGSPWLEGADFPTALAAERFARGDEGVAALRKGHCVGYAWWANKSYLEREVNCLFEWGNEPAAVFDFDVFVKPEHRMGLGFMAVWDGLLQELRSAGIQCSFSRISRFNLSSMRAHERLGAQPIGTVSFLRVGRLLLALSGRPLSFRFARVDGKPLRLQLSAEGLRWLYE
ncbi:MAG: GNAT family N-acetyltransferase [Rubrivivax sp.]